MLNPTISLDLYLSLVDGDPNFETLLGLDAVDFPTLEHEDLLAAALDADSPLSQALNELPTVVSSEVLTFGSGANRLSVFFDNLSGIGSIEDLIDEVFDSSSSGLFTGLEMVAYGQQVISGTFTDTLISFSSGDVTLELDGALTNSLADLGTLIDAVVELEFDNLLEDEFAQQSLQALLTGFGLSGIRLIEDGTTFAELSLAADRLALNIGGAELEALGTFPLHDFGGLFGFLMDAADFEGGNSLPGGLVLDGLTLKDTDGTTHLSVPGTQSEPGDFDFGTIRIEGGSEGTWNVPDIAKIFDDVYDYGDVFPFPLVDEGQTYVFDLGGGEDEFEFYLRDRVSAFEYSDEAVAPVVAYGGAGTDELEIKNDSSWTTYVTVDLPNGRVTSEYQDYRSTPFDGPSMEFRGFENVELQSFFADTFWTVYGNAADNRIKLENGPGFVSVLGRGGQDTVNLADAFFDPFDYHYDSGNRTLVEFQLAFETVQFTGHYRIYDRSNGSEVARLRNVELVEFESPDHSGYESYDISALLVSPAAGGFDSIPGDDLLVRENFSGLHRVANGIEGQHGQSLGRALNDAVGLIDSDGNGADEVVFRQQSNGRHTLVDPTDGSSSFLGRRLHTFIDGVDADGDGADELVFQRLNGGHYVMETDGTTVLNVGRRNETYQGSGDINGDGIEDMVFTRANGRAFWVDGDTNGATNFKPNGTAEFLGLGDFNDDGHVDGVFEGARGGKFVVSGATNQTLRTYARHDEDIVAVGDFDGDGADDLCFWDGDTLDFVDGQTGQIIASRFIRSDTPGEGLPLMVLDANGDGADDVLMTQYGSLTVFDPSNSQTNSMYPNYSDAVYVTSPMGLAGLDEFQLA